MRNQLLMLMCVAACSAEQTDERVQAEGGACDTTQIFGNPAHTGQTCGALAGLQIKGTAVVDPDAAQAAADRGFYSMHQGAALTLGSWSYLPKMRGYSGQLTKATKTWSIEARRWVGGIWTSVWSRDAGFRPVDAINPFSLTNRYEQLFQPVIAKAGHGRAATALFVPAVSGRVDKLDPVTGAVLATIDPLAGTAFAGDARVTISSALAEHDGAVWYTVIAWPTSNFTSVPPRASWAVRIDAADHATIAPWTAIATAALGIAQPFESACEYDFGVNLNSPHPWPPSPTAQLPLLTCGGQEPALNVAPAFSDGRVYLTSTENNAITYAYMVAIDEATMAPLQALSLHRNFLDACGIFIPYSATSANDPAAIDLCRLGTTLGFDPNQNHAVAGREYGIMEASPVVLPDGRVCIGSYSGSYNHDVGHLSCFGTKGELTTYRFGWESTPPVRTLPGGDFELVIDDSSTTDGTDSTGEFAVARLSSALTVKDRTVLPVDPTAAAADFLDGQMALDNEGNAYPLNASGRVLQVSPSGAIIGSVDLGLSTEPLAHEAAWGSDDVGNAILYVGFGGTMFAIGASDHTTHAVGPRTIVPVTRGAKHGGDGQ